MQKGSTAALKKDTETLNYNFYAGEICKVLEVWKDYHNTEFAYIENDRGRKIVIETKFLENVQD